MIEDLIELITRHNPKVTDIALGHLHWVLEWQPETPDLDPKYEDFSKALYISRRALQYYMTNYGGKND